MTTDHAAEALAALQLADKLREEGSSRAGDRALYTGLIHAVQAVASIVQPAAPPLAVFRVEFNGKELGTYAERHVAQLACVGYLEANDDVHGYLARWRQLGADAVRLTVQRDLANAGEDTGYAVRTVPVLRAVHLANGS